MWLKKCTISFRTHLGASLITAQFPKRCLLMCVGGMTPAGRPLVTGPYVGSRGPLHRATPTESSHSQPHCHPDSTVLVHWKCSGVPSGATGLETASCTSDPHSPQNLAFAVKSSPKPVLLEAEPSSRCPCWAMMEPSTLQAHLIPLF